MSVKYEFSAVMMFQAEVFCVLTVRNVVVWYQRSEDLDASIFISPWRWRQQGQQSNV